MTVLTMVGAGCGTTTPTPIDGAAFLVSACGDQHFRVQVRDPAVISEAERLIGADRQRIISGELRRGSGGVNAPWSWHLDPETIGFADVTIELCDGCPDFVESDLDYWVDTVGRYCPWSTRMVQRLR